MNFKLIISFFLLSGIVLLSSCREDLVEETTTTVTTTTDPELIHTSDVSGLIVTQDGAPIADASVQLNIVINNIVTPVTKNTDDNGYFLFEDVDISEEGSYMIVDKIGYFKGYKFIFANLAGERQHIKIRMADAAIDDDFNSTQGGEINLNTGAKLTIPADAVSRLDGTSYDGTVEVAMHYFDPEDGTMTDMMPGDLRAINNADEIVQLATFGMIGVELFSTNGEKLNIKDGFDATLEFPLSPELLATAPESIPLWHFEENSGVWREEGSASIIGGKYVGKVKHFSFWNCDAPFPLVKITGKVLDPNGYPMAFTGICVSVVNGWTAASGYTNENGVFCGKMPANEKLEISIKDNCGNVVFTTQIGPFSEDTDLGPLTVDANGQIQEITGTLVDCDDNPVTEGYVIVSANWQTFVVEADENGDFQAIISDCQAGLISIYAVDNGSLMASEPMDLSPNAAGVYDAGTIQICDTNLDEYIRWTVAGGVLNINEEPNAVLQNGNLIFGQDSFINAAYFNMTINNAAVNAGIVEFVTAWSASSTGNFSNQLCSNAGGQSCNDFSVDITSMGAIGDYIIGTFSGILYENGMSVDVAGDFRVRLDDITMTTLVSGSTWLDANENGLQDPNEGPMVNALILAELNGDFVAETLSDQNGNWSFDNLIDGADYVFYFEDFQGTGFDITLKDVGTDDTIDNDFDPSTGYTDVVTVTSGTTDYNLDLGLITVAQSLSCDANTSGCGFNSEIQVFTTGGVPPYTYEFQGNVISQNPPFIYSGLSAGAYTGTVTDANGEVCTFNVFVESSIMSVSGVVFDDADANMLLDSLGSGLDLPLGGVVIDLVDLNFNVLTTTTSDAQGFYGFEIDAIDFQYYIRATAPNGYTFLQPMQGGSEVSVDGLSEILDNVDCFNNYNVNIGLTD